MCCNTIVDADLCPDDFLGRSCAEMERNVIMIKRVSQLNGPCICFLL